jgi:hypothetical protein
MRLGVTTLRGSNPRSSASREPCAHNARTRPPSEAFICLGEALGPFQASREALAAVRREDGSLTGSEALFDLLKETMHATDVTLGAWGWVVLRWLADLDTQTVAAVAGWVSRGNGELRAPDDADGLEPYCADCGHWIGMFFGLEGWRHFHGDPAPAAFRKLGAVAVLTGSGFVYLVPLPPRQDHRFLCGIFGIGSGPARCHAGSCR